MVARLLTILRILLLTIWGLARKAIGVRGLLQRCST